MKKIDDTIAAAATPAGKGAISVIRISGKDAFACFCECFRSLPHRESSREQDKAGAKIAVSALKQKKRVYGVIIDNAGIVDEVVASVFVSPHSYTGEDLIELSCHCNPYIVEQIMRLLLERCRLAEPGEFTLRAFINNKIDLVQAEAVGDLLNVKTKASHRAAMQQLEGSLSGHISLLLEELTRYRINLEVEIDFSEHEPQEMDTAELKKNLLGFKNKLETLITKGMEGRIIRDGLNVCIAGAPNVGKSSLFNALLKNSRAIVTDRPGTTRDYLEEQLSIDGYLVKLTDTAGLRTSGDEPETIGIDMSIKIIEQAEKIIYIEDHISGLDDYTKKQLDSVVAGKIVKVLNKTDILDEKTIEHYENKGYLTVSAKTGEGLERLRRHIVKDFHLSGKDIDQGVLSNLRQIKAVEKCKQGIEAAIDAIESGYGFEFLAFDLKSASEYLEEIIGKISDDDILNSIFADFCIGK